MHKINKSVFDIVENIAEKEIDRDPLEFIRRESFVDTGKFNLNDELT